MLKNRTSLEKFFDVMPPSLVPFSCSLRKLTKSSEQTSRKNSIHRILTNKFYIGIIVDKKTGEEYPHIYDTLIEKDVFDTAQDILNGHSTKRQRHYGVEVTYRAMMTCSECGYSLTPDPKSAEKTVMYITTYTITTLTTRSNTLVTCIASWKRSLMHLCSTYRSNYVHQRRIAILKKELVEKHKEKNALYDKRRTNH